MSKLVHVRKIEIADSRSLEGLLFVDNTSCRLGNAPSFSEISIRELVGVTVDDEYENNQRVYTTTATFSTCEKMPLSRRRVVFRLTSMDGRRYLIGTDSRPYPVFRESNAFPGKAGDSILKKVTITWKSLFPMLLIIE